MCDDLVDSLGRRILRYERGHARGGLPRGLDADHQFELARCAVVPGEAGLRLHEYLIDGLGLEFSIEHNAVGVRPLRSRRGSGRHSMRPVRRRSRSPTAPPSSDGRPSCRARERSIRRASANRRLRPAASDRQPARNGRPHKAFRRGGRFLRRTAARRAPIRSPSWPARSARTRSRSRVRRAVRDKAASCRQGRGDRRHKNSAR